MQLYIAVGMTAFLLAYLVNYKSYNNQKVVLVLNETCYHLHHWLTLTGLLAAGFFFSFVPKRIIYTLVAAMIGFIIEGLIFKDFWKIRSDCERPFTITASARSRYPEES